MHGISYTVTRIISNDLPPLHGETQTYLNTKLILEREKLPSDFERIWILNSILNKTKKDHLRRLISSHREVYHIINPPSTKDAKILQNEVLNINKARNFAIEKSFQLGAKWVLILDGCSFLTSESLRSIENVLRRRNQSEVLYFLPMVRLQHKALQLSTNIRYEELFPYVSGQQECQIAINRDVFRSDVLERASLNNSKGLVFDEEKLYAEEPKLSFLEAAKNRLTDKHVYCKEAMIGYTRNKSENAQQDLGRMKKCGYVLRLLYHPEESSPINQSLSARQRGFQRKMSKNNFQLRLKNYAKGLK